MIDYLLGLQRQGHKVWIKDQTKADDDVEANDRLIDFPRELQRQGHKVTSRPRDG